MVGINWVLSTKGLEKGGGVGGGGGLANLGLVLSVERLGLFEVLAVKRFEVDRGEGAAAGVVLVGDFADGVGGGEGQGRAGGPVDGRAAQAAEELARQRAEKFACVLLNDLPGHAHADGGDELLDGRRGQRVSEGLANTVHHFGLQGDDGESGEVLGKELDGCGEDGVAEYGCIDLSRSGVGCGDLRCSQGRKENGGGRGFVMEGVGELNVGGGAGEGAFEGDGELVKEGAFGGGGGSVGFTDGKGGFPGDGAEFVGGEQFGLGGGCGFLEDYGLEDVGEVGVAEGLDDLADTGAFAVGL